MSFKVKRSADEVKVTYGNHEKFVISAELLNIVQEVDASIDQSASDYKDVLVRKVKERAGKNVRLLLELAVYARVVVGIHPRDLTLVTSSIGPGGAKEYRSICMHAAKAKQWAAANS